MKVTVKHPVVTSIRAPKGRTNQKTVMTTKTTFDIPVLMTGSSVTPAVSFVTDHGTKNQRSMTVMEDGAGNFFLPVTKDGGDVVATNFKLLESAIAGHISQRIGHRLAGKNEKIILGEKGGGPASKADLTTQPDLSGIPADRIDLEDLRAESDWIAAGMNDFVFVGRSLHSRIPQPFYAVTSTYTGLSSLTLEFGPDLPEDMVACFGLGKLDEARTFAKALSERRNGQQELSMTKGLVETTQSASDMDYLGLTAAANVYTALRRFKNEFHPEYRARQVTDELMFDVPLEQLALARRMHAICQDRGFHLMASDPEPLWQIIEDLTELGPKSYFSRKRESFYADLVLGLWQDEEITLNIPRAATP